MSRESMRTIGYVLLFAAIAVVIIFFDDIRAAVSEMMMEQTDSLVDQLLR